MVTKICNENRIKRSCRQIDIIQRQWNNDSSEQTNTAYVIWKEAIFRMGDPAPTLNHI